MRRQKRNRDEDFGGEAGLIRTSVDVRVGASSCKTHAAASDEFVDHVYVRVSCQPYDNVVT